VNHWTPSSQCRHISKPGEKTYHGHFLASTLSESLGPLHLSGVSLTVKVLVAFRTAELEGLLDTGRRAMRSEDEVRWTGQCRVDDCVYLAIVSDKSHAVSGIDRTTAEIANADSHFDEYTKSINSLEILAKWPQLGRRSNRLFGGHHGLEKCTYKVAMEMLFTSNPPFHGVS